MRTLCALTMGLVFSLVLVTAAQARTATVEFYIGDLHYAVAPDTAFAPASLGQVLGDKAYLRTGAESRAEIRLDDGTLLRMQENTTIQLYTDVPDALQLSATAVGLSGGSVFVLKGRVAGGEEFQVRTPIAVAAIRGTEFLDGLAGEENEVQVLRGDVDVTSLRDGRKVRVTRGQAARVQGMLAPAVRELNNQELGNLLGISETERFQEGKPGTGTGEGEGTGGEGEGTEKVKPPESYQPRTGRAGVQYGATVGAVVIDGRLVNMIGLRPEFTIRKVGVGLDLSLYLDADGKVLDEYWDDPQDYLDKIYYVRYAQKADPFYLRAGALEEVSLGYGIIMREYSNTVEYPSTIRVGAELGLHRDRFLLNAMFANFRELAEPGVLGGRFAYRPLVGSSLPFVDELEVGASAVYDGNAFAAVENQLDGELPDSLYADRDALVWGLDAGMPALRTSWVDLDVYGQFAQIDGYGHGLTLPGFRAVSGPVRAEFEYCIFGKQFISDFFNRTYDLERVQSLGGTDPFHKRNYIAKEEFLAPENDPARRFQDSKQGWYGGLGVNLLNFVDLWGSIQMLGSGDTADQSGYLEGVANTSWIPRISLLSAYAQQTHVVDLFEFERGASTVYGGRVGYELAPGASIILGVRGTYEDRDGDGVLEAIRTTQIETAFRF